MKKSAVHALIVAYRPDIEVLNRAIAAIAPQVGQLLLVANDGGSWSCRLPANAVLVEQDINSGLGAAYNLAIRWGQRTGAKYLLLLDQDSVSAPGMVALLLRAFKEERVAAAGPLWRDNRNGQDGFFVRLTGRGARRYQPSAGEIVPVGFLISSGSLISLDALTEIGMFDENLFIDHVDTDWAFRAREKGYRLYGVADARLDHSFGEATMTLAAFGLERRIFRYSADRNYYLLRNSIIMWRRPYVTWGWILRDAGRTGFLTIFHVLCVPPRFTRIRLAFRAVRDAFSH